MKKIFSTVPDVCEAARMARTIASVEWFNRCALPLLRDLEIFDPEAPLTKYLSYDLDYFFVAFMQKEYGRTLEPLEMAAIMRKGTPAAWVDYNKTHFVPHDMKGCEILYPDSIFYDTEKGEYICDLDPDKAVIEIRAENDAEGRLYDQLKALQTAMDAVTLDWSDVNIRWFFRRGTDGRIDLFKNIDRPTIEILTTPREY